MAAPIPATVRLSKRVSEMAHCSRREAEQYIAGGWVRVEGVVVSAPGFKVSRESVQLDAAATPEAAPPVTLLLHKPPDYGAGARPPDSLLNAQSRWNGERSGIRFLQRHVLHQFCATPLETAASGLMVFTQEARVRRKLAQDAALLECELMVGVQGAVSAATLEQLNRSRVIAGRAMTPARVSIGSQQADLTGLRFAIKGWFPGQIADTCSQLGLRIATIKRIRIGRVALGPLELGQWRYLMPYERF